MEKFENREKPISIQIASVKDAEGIGRVHAETWLSTYPNEEYGITREDVEAKIATRVPTREAHWRKVIEDETGIRRVWVAKDGPAHVVGFCLAHKAQSENKVDAIYVLPEFQAKGIGQKLMQQAMQWSGSDKPLLLNVAKYNEDAIKFYQKLGFILAGEVEASKSAELPSGKIIPEIKMIKPAS